MLTLLIIFSAIVLSGIAFWFYNKRQINSLSDQLDDKNVVISALRNHVENDTPVFNPNENWRPSDVNPSTNLTPSVEDALSSKKPKNQYNGGKKGGQKSGQKKQTAPAQQPSQTKKPRKKNV
jgi:hypothetical protein